MRVDPEGRCAVMLIYGNKLVVLPFKKDTGTEDIDAFSQYVSFLHNYYNLSQKEKGKVYFKKKSSTINCGSSTCSKPFISYYSMNIHCHQDTEI